MTDGTDGPRITRRAWLKAAGTGSIAAMGSLASYAGPAAAQSDKLTVLHGWCGGDGAKAIAALMKGFQKAHPDVENVDDSGVCGGGNTNLNAVVAKRVQNRDYPSTWSDWPGKNLLQFTQADVLGDIGDSVWSHNGMKDAYLELPRNAAKPAGNYVTVPINIHRINNLFYNVHVFEDAGVDPTSLKSASDLLDASKTIADETDAVPFAHSTKSPWPTLDLFEVLLLAEHGPESYNAFTNGKADDETVSSTLDLVKQYKEYFPGDAATISWTEANQKVMNGKAAYIVQGDWAAGAYRGKDGFDYEKDWNHVPFPGSEGYYGLNMDSFVYPKPNPTPEKTTTFLRYCGTKDAQARFNKWKGSIPPRGDVEMDEFPPFQQAQAKDFRNAKAQLPSIAHGLAVPPDQYSQLMTAMGNFLGSYDVDSATKAFQNTVQG